ncbi:MAG: response regulator transcription factor [Rhodoblastus sp.]
MAQVRKLLLVDDDDDLRSSLAEQLTLHEEFTIVQAATGAEAVSIARDQTPDLTLLDVGLPDMDGREAVKLLRREGYTNPIIMVTGHTSDADTVLGLESGANDYILKPFKFNILLARIRVQLRQFEQSDDATFVIGPYIFHPRSKNLSTRQGGKLRLTEKETAILRFLHKAAPNTVTREVLLRDVWGYNANVTTHTLETHIYRLRQKIEEDPVRAKLLITDGGGYRLAL